MSRKSAAMTTRKVRATVSGLNLQPGADVRKPGSMTVAQNVVFDRKGIATPRPGFQVWWPYGGAYPLDAAIYTLYDDLTNGQTIVGFGGSGVKAIHSSAGFRAINIPSSANMAAPLERGYGTVHPMASIKGNTYVGTENGVMRLCSAAGPGLRAAEYAGMLPVFIGSATVYDAATATVGPNWMPDQSCVAYQAVLKKKDQNGDWIVGPVSGRFTLSNTSGALRAAQVKVYLPTQDIQNSSNVNPYYWDGFVVQLFRSGTSLLATSSTPDDHMQLVAETTVTSAMVTATFLTITDISFDYLRQDELYTNTSTAGTGPQSNKTLVPRAFDLCVWKERLWGLGYRGPQRFTLQILAVGGLNGIQAADTFTFDNGSSPITLTAGAGGFTLVTALTPAQNIEATAQNMCFALNSTYSWLRAFYVASPTDPLSVGRIKFETRLNSTTKFYVRCGTPRICYIPDLPSSNSATTQSNGDDFSDAVWFSEAKEPDAVPLGNVLRVGAAGRSGIRIVPTRDTLYVFKSDGCYTVTGDSPANFTVTLLDPTLLPVAPETICQYDSGICGWFSTGVMKISGAGAQVISGPINDYLRLFAFGSGLNATFQTVYRRARACQDNTNKRYLMLMPNGYFSAGCTNILVYDGKTDEWGMWVSALQSPPNCLYESLLNIGTAPEVIPARSLLAGTCGGSDTVYKLANSGNATDFQETTAFNAAAGTQTLTGIPCEVDHVVEAEGDSSALKQFVEVIARFENSGQVPSDLAVTAYAGDAANHIASVGPAAMAAPSGLVARGIRRQLLGINGTALTLKFTWTAGGTPSSALFQNYLGYTLEERDFGGEGTP